MKQTKIVDPAVQVLIQHFSLAEVLAFIAERDAVRSFIACDEEPETSRTERVNRTQAPDTYREPNYYYRRNPVTESDWK